jgi:hypothetical protein
VYVIKQFELSNTLFEWKEIGVTCILMVRNQYRKRLVLRLVLKYSILKLIVFRVAKGKKCNAPIRKRSGSRN